VVAELKDRDLLGEIGAQPASGFNKALEIELSIRFQHSVRIDGELFRNLLDSGKLIAGLQHAHACSVFDLLDYLKIGRDSGILVKEENDHSASNSKVIIH